MVPSWSRLPDLLDGLIMTTLPPFPFPAIGRTVAAIVKGCGDGEGANPVRGCIMLGRASLSKTACFA
ncbi:hypothetical protein Rleg_2543 [Rhizobium leguminosarum bv. trifolii WSM1325]|uniref:Uncharacterized protein n=2 Tax=Rhizobium leguminosarum TaxID=384 RepID=C6B2W6_RHILS|nr:hypothetical protein Rleg_2543 [Rhizobium leguminosarum bv. trifolii WSM1325]